MNFEYSEKEEKFRSEVREWLKETLGSEEVEKIQNQLKVLFLPSGLPWTE